MRALGGHRRHGGGFARLPRRSGHAARLLSGQGRTGPRRAGPWLRALAWLAVSACLLPGPPAALVIILPCRHALTLSLQPAPSAVRGPSTRPAPPGQRRPAPPRPSRWPPGGTWALGPRTRSSAPAPACVRPGVLRPRPLSDLALCARAVHVGVTRPRRAARGAP